MRVATLVVVFALGIDLAAPVARAQNQPVPSSAAPIPPRVDTWPTPMSQRLILNRGPSGAGYKLERGGLLLLDNRYADGLDLAVTGSERAVELAREAHGNLVTGAVLGWTGLGLVVASLVGGLAVAAAFPPNNGSTPTAGGVGLGIATGGVLTGLVLELVGIPYQLAGVRLECDAVNAYNQDLVDGKLGAGR